MDERPNGAHPHELTVAPAKVCLVISSFRHDQAVERILERLFAATSNPFAKVIVVDSLGTGRMPGLVRERHWNEVSYHCFSHNLGSAGNLAERLRLAAATDATFAYAINHDAHLDLSVVHTLIEHADGMDRLGALFPLRRLVRRSNRLDTAGAHDLPLPFLGTKPSEELPALLPVKWSSSNGALYALAPIREGLAPWGDFWFGWEDLAYGWLLDAHGYRQYIVSAARVDDDYEYRDFRIGPLKVKLSDKPSWYAYYQTRNLLLATQRTRSPLAVKSVVAGRIALEVALTTVFREEKMQRLHNLFCGLVDGLSGRSGKWDLP
jgi:GT2 family glycosyltransferase